MLGENFYGPRSLHAAVQAGAGDYLMPDLMRIGGVTGWLRAAAIAGAAGIQMSSHLYPEVSAICCGCRDRPLAGVAGLGAPDPGRAVRSSGGHLLIRDVPGAGLEWDEGAVRRFRMD